MHAVLRDALPEFLGSLGAALVLASTAWATSRLRSRGAEARRSRTDGQQSGPDLGSGQSSM
ncbi:hypothetical protein ACFWJY_11005 [Streptomyces anulatus]|uniref:hypothetical protein n=1 Tax=Streptomyces TaxID=1883 RepID=UPI000BF05479|nr:hypothetical protein [Streptomyces sp. or20]